MKRILVVGAGGHGQVVVDILLSSARAGVCVKPIGFLDDDENLAGTMILGLPVLGNIADLSGIDYDEVIVAIGDNSTRRHIFSMLMEQGARFANAIHPTATIGQNVHLGVGVMICAGAIVNTCSTIGNGAILNTSCTVDHHDTVGEYAHICPGVNLGGNVVVGDGALVGIGSAVIPERSVGEWSVIGAGSVVICDIPARRLAVGLPARVKRDLS